MLDHKYIIMYLLRSERRSGVFDSRTRISKHKINFQKLFIPTVVVLLRTVTTSLLFSPTMKLTILPNFNALFSHDKVFSCQSRILEVKTIVCVRVFDLQDFHLTLDTFRSQTCMF